MTFSHFWHILLLIVIYPLGYLTFVLNWLSNSEINLSWKQKDKAYIYNIADQYRLYTICR